MKIVGGSYGLKGSAHIVGSTLIVNGTKKAECPSSSFKSVKARQDSDKKFGIVGAIIGSFIFGWVGLYLSGFLGAVVGVAISIAGSFYSVKKRFVDIELVSGESVTLQCSSGEVDSLLRL